MAKPEPTSKKEEKINPLRDPIRWTNSLSKSDLEREATSLESQLLLGRLATSHKLEGATVGECWREGRRRNEDFPREIDYQQV